MVLISGNERQPVTLTGADTDFRRHDGALVLVLNSGSSSVKLALLDPGSGRRVVAGLAKNVGTAEAVVHCLAGGSSRCWSRPLLRAGCRKALADGVRVFCLDLDILGFRCFCEDTVTALNTVVSGTGLSRPTAPTSGFPAR